MQRMQYKNVPVINHKTANEVMGEEQDSCCNIGAFSHTTSITDEAKKSTLDELQVMCSGIGKLNPGQRNEVVKFIEAHQRHMNSGSEPENGVTLEVPKEVFVAFGIIDNMDAIMPKSIAFASQEIQAPSSRASLGRHSAASFHDAPEYSMEDHLAGKVDVIKSASIKELLTNLNIICAHRSFYTPFSNHTSKTNWFTMVNMTKTAQALCNFIQAGKSLPNQQEGKGGYGSTRNNRTNYIMTDADEV